MCVCACGHVRLCVHPFALRLTAVTSSVEAMQITGWGGGAFRKACAQLHSAMLFTLTVILLGGGGVTGCKPSVRAAAERESGTAARVGGG